MFGNKRQLDKCIPKDITIGDDVVQRAEVIKLLEVKLYPIFVRTYNGQVWESNPQSTQHKTNQKFTGQ